MSDDSYVFEGPAEAPAAPRDNNPPLSISELSFALKRTLEDRFGHVRLRGEISKVNRHASGHVCGQVTPVVRLVATPRLWPRLWRACRRRMAHTKQFDCTVGFRSIATFPFVLRALDATTHSLTHSARSVGGA